MPITKRDVDKLQIGQTIWDAGRGAVMGFGVRRQRNLPAFVLKARFQGRQRWFTIGRFGAPWTVEAARDQARVLLGQLASGADPATKAAADLIASMTVAELCDEYLEAARAGRVLTRFGRPKRNSTLKIDEGRVKRHIKPLIGTKIARKISRADVAKLIDDISAGRTAADVRTKVRGRAIVKGGAGTASRVADLLSGIFSWAQKRGVIDQNPVHGAERYRGEPRDRFLRKDELGRLGHALAMGVDEDGRRFHPYAVEIVLLLCLTGCRLNEIAGLRWEECDLDSSCLRLAQTKTGKSLRAVGSSVIARLRAATRQAESPYVFPSVRGDAAYQGTRKQAAQIFAAAGISNATCHTLRHTFATHASELEFSELTIAGLLGHRGRTVTSRYAHKPDAALVVAADTVSATIHSILFSAPST